MRINWHKFVRPIRREFLFAGFFFCLASIVILYLYFDKERIKSKNDISFIKGAFEGYRWLEHQGRGGSSLTFKLQNYDNQFKIKADFYSILDKEKFKSIVYGDILTIGIPNRFTKYLNAPKDYFFVYSISSKDVNYLDLNKVISKHNSSLPLYAAILFLMGGLVSIYFGRRAKKEH